MRRLPPRTGQFADDWRTDASCRGLDTNLFFPPGSVDANWAALDHARRICDHCPVQQACLQWALTAHITDGIWGGLTPTERRSHRRNQRGNSHLSTGALRRGPTGPQ